MCDGTIQTHIHSVLSLGKTEPQSSPERQKSDPISTLAQTVQAFLCPISAFPCTSQSTQGNFDPPWSRQLMTMLLATGSSAFSAQTALPVLKFAYKNLCVPESDSSFLMTFSFLSPFLILILSHLPS